MGRGPTVAHQKEANARARAKVFTIHAKLIALAARSGDDPALNPALHDAIVQARKDNVPNDNIERAIARGSGKDKDAQEILEMTYEGYAPGGVAVVVSALTDNRNRTAPNMRHAFSKYGGSLGETGSITGFAFDFVGVIEGGIGLRSPDDIEMIIMSSDAQDYEIDSLSDTYEIITAPQDVARVRGQIADQLAVESVSREYRAKNRIILEDFDKVLKLYKLLSDLSEDDDVSKVAHNAEIDPQVWQQAADTIESQRFRT